MITMSPNDGHQTDQQTVFAANQSFLAYLTERIKLPLTNLVAVFMIVGAIGCSDALAAYPTQETGIGDVVTNPATGEDVIVVDLILDPPEAGIDPPETTYVNTSDDYFILVKNQVGDLIYFVDENNNFVTYEVIATDQENGVASLQIADNPEAKINPVPYAEERPVEEEGEAEKTEEDISVNGVRIVSTAPGGKHGSWGTLFVPPTQGKRGTDGYPVNYNNTQHISTTDQIGIEAASIGGNGGGGGDSYGSFWDGKRGGDGGKGGYVNVTNEADGIIQTTGSNAHGIYAYSRSGQAGHGGSGYVWSGGGAGGHASDGGNVTVTNKGMIQTNNDGAHGIYALSVSGNGGTGGDSWGIVGKSGSGNAGGNGGIVTVTNDGTIRTSGANAQGILAQSIGGTGGSAGDSGGLLAFSGSGEAGGNGGEVEIKNNGSITTTGNYSRGIFAQSIGGGGGSGGDSGGLLALGGVGAGGGNSGKVTVINSLSGQITTTEVGSDGIFAQSVGGSGGGGSNAGGLFAIGGDGAVGGNGGEVVATNLGIIETQGNYARGLVAESIGGGGGDGGSSGGMVAVGGSGEGGGSSATVSVTQAGRITTMGHDASGIFAQSVGGGGGNGGSAGSVSAFVGVAVGGKGGPGGAGGDVNLNMQGTDAGSGSLIRTKGDRSTGIFAQSVGGGGGNGGGAVQATGGFMGAVSIAVGGAGGVGGYGGNVIVSQGDGLSIIETGGTDSTGMFLQSVGGGGGNGGYAVSIAASGGPVSGSVSVGIGGAGGAGGEGGEVNAGLFDEGGTLLNPGFSGSILTKGERSPGLIAQSVGGGGGNGGLAISSAVSGGAIAAGSVSVGVGGDGGAGGAGGTVSVGTQGNITTEDAYSPGMLVQSVGGGGGNGGGAISGALAAAGVGAGSVAVGLGGKGGEGNAGGEVTLATREGTITTKGDNSTAITAQSIGGGGGNGGYSVAIGLAGAGIGAGAVTVGLGGSGGKGADGGMVTADLQSDVFTMGDYSGGLLTQSVGGGGGNGGFSVSAGAAGAGVGAGTVSVGLGGAGEDGGTGGSVEATSSGTIHTLGDHSSGFIAQSIGGGGGNGGFSISGSISGGGVGSGAVSVGLGGNGGGGSDAGTVKASTSEDIITEGVGSTGILAQSVGGGGGNGGFNVSVALSGAGTGSGAVGVGLGGKGAGGGNGSNVDLEIENNVYTLKNDSTAIIAQSIGGGGGNGGFNVSVAGSGAGTGSGAVGVGIGGSGGGGGDSGDVTSVMTGDILTMGENSSGLLVQSVGGGGGNGGFNVAAAISVAGTGSGGAAVGIGGSAGDGGFSGTVESLFTGNLTTMGKYAPAVTAQSLGGGGGNGGLSIAGTISGAGTGSGAASVGIGGAGGGGGNSSTVKNTVTGDISTIGLGSTGVLAQSLGGGGGNGGLNVSGSISAAGTGTGAVSVGIGGSGGDGGNAMKVTNQVKGTVVTTGADATAIIAQSLGGGGGNGGINVTGTIAAAKTGAGAIGVGVGGSGGGGGDAGEVDNMVSGYVQSSGDNSMGILAQSLGGGGGNGGLNVTGTITAAKTGSGGLSVGVGGFGGDGGNASEVKNTFVGGTITTGNNANGIVAQSIGGGGGNGGINVSASMNFTKENGGTLGVGIGGFGGNGGDAGNVDSLVTTSTEYTRISTTGDDSSAVIAQSIGGGGGNGGLNVTGSVNATGKNGAAIGVGVGGFGGGAGDAGNVKLGVTGDIITEGNNSHGLIAQSVGGGGGNGGTNVTGSLAMTKPASEDSSTTVAASIGIGGFGGGGGHAGNVDLDFSGTIVAQPRVLVGQSVDQETGETIPEHYEFKEGSGSHGILAQSLGGGGGNGGINVSAGISYAAGESDGHALLVGFGGFGGEGGNAGNVDVSVGGGQSISAYGAGNAAIMAQSAGGGGGNGALNVSGGVVSDSPLIVGVGGMGGNGGIGGDVKVSAFTDVYTIASPDDETHSAGIMAQSLGGGGGNGGINISGGISIDKGKAPSITVGVGGFGGTGSQSGDVDIFHLGNATTVGGWTHGIFAQSIAGGGGNGGLNVSGQFNWADSENSGGAKDLSIVAGIGGHGGSGADAGAVSVLSFGDNITTSGDYSRGIYAQSIGGGGGTGGMNVTGVFAKNSSPITLGIGGFGSGGGNAGSVSVVRRSQSTGGKISTEGVGAIGIEASSIGGGGGDAGMNFVVGISLAADKQEDNDGSEEETSSTREHPKHTGVDESVFTNYDKVIDELEGRSPSDSEDKNDASKDSPFAAQIAIGGSAGDAGHGNLATVDNYGDIETNGNDSHGILAQSIGGGGGNANLNLAATYQGKSDDSKGFNFTLGGATGDGGNGAKVQLDHEGMILTRGEDAYGLFAQSVGGGGGNVGFDFNTMQTKGGKIGINLGRMGGSGGFGDDVSLTSQGTVATLGNRSYAILAQSIGNGGGNSSSTTISAELSGDEEDGTPPRAASITIGLEGGEGGSAGNVDVEVGGIVSTVGESAHAVFAQSVGGGGGNAGDAKSKASTVAISLGASGGAGGTGGKIKVTNNAVITTQGQDALGILAQSIGGGGGTGSMTESKAQDFAIAVGGGGGDGATSDDVRVTNRGDIMTEGEASYAILAQSIGGGGGNAKSTKSTLEKKKPKEKQAEAVETSAEQSGEETDEASKAVQVSLAVGGQGGTGASSGNVTVGNYGGIATTGNQAIGIFAQSVGGGGGNAAQAASSVTSELGSGFLLGLGIGGSGGEGGKGGDVVVSNLVDSDAGETGQIITLGDGAHGVLAMSIGGGGGNGSTVIAKTNAKNQNEKNAASAFAVGIGGSGGIGGTGGKVTVTNAGQISTYGAKAHGIIAQSIGGGGGNGGLTISGNQAMGSQKAGSKAGSFALGGSGGAGNTAGDVTVINTGAIEVFGDESYGIYAQSVGGGGGDGALSVGLSTDLSRNPFTNLAPSLMNVGIGGSGGDGGNGGNVFIDHQGSIIGHGENAYGIYAQSVGGGGGNVGTSISSPVWMASDLGISALLGGRDGNNGDAGTVTINTVGDIMMTGSNSQAYFAQAVNGGGGNLRLFLDVSEKGTAYSEDSTGLSEELTFIEQITAKLSTEFGLGAEKSSDSSGSKVQANHAGNLYTGGDRAIASSTQSIGGGGGSANIGIVANSEANADISLILGGTESSANHGGDVDLSREGNIGTMGSQSPGVDVQSIGGGGGNLTLNLLELAVIDERSAEGTAGIASNSPSQVKTADLSPITDGIVAASAQVGAKFSANNAGGDIKLTYSGDLETLGTLSPGLIVQTIGGGGGQISITGVDSLLASLGASGNSTGDGGNVDLSNQGSIYTSGRLSHGIMIQSIGGGGGVIFTGLDQSSINLSLIDGGVGHGGDIKLAQVGDVVTSGLQAHGVFIQSLGGGGGAVDNMFAGTSGGQGSSGNITVTLNDNVISSGTDATGVFLQSLGDSGTTRGDISLLLNGDLIMGGSGAGIGVRIDGGSNNKLVNHAIVQTLEGANGQALVGSIGNEEIENFGTITGNIDLGAGSNQINNQPSALINSGLVIGLGFGNTLTNAGDLAPGGRGNELVTRLQGNYLQSSEGKLDIDVDLSHEMGDSLSLTGAADLSGELVANPIKAGYAKPGQYDQVALSADSGVIANSMSLSAPNSAVVSYEIAQLGQNDLVVRSNVDFSPQRDGTLDRNARRLAEHVNDIQSAGGSESFAPIAAALVALPDDDSLNTAYEQMNPELYGNLVAETVASDLKFNEALHSCRKQDGEYRFMQEGECLWLRLDGSYRDQEHTSKNLGYDINTVTLSGGYQWDLVDDNFIGFGLSYMYADLDGKWSDSDGSQFEGGVIYKRFYGANMFSGTLSAGYGWYDTDRDIGLPTPGVEAHSDQDIYFASLHGRYSHDFQPQANQYIRPIFDLGFTRTHRESFDENGAEGANMDVKAETESFVTFQPAVEIGGEITLTSGTLLRPYAKLGVTQFLTDNDHEITANLEGAPNGVGNFTIETEGDRTFGDLALGLDVLRDKGVNVRIDYSGQISENTTSHYAGIKLSIPF